jgi:MFS family permease
VKDFPGLIAADRSFGFFMLAQLMSTAARVAAPFYILSAGNIIHLDGKVLGAMSLAFLGADTAINMLWGYLGDKFGFKTTFVGSVMLWIAATGLLIAVPHMPHINLLGFDMKPIAWIFLSFFGLGSAQSGQMMSSQTMVLEFGSREDMAMRLAFTQTAQGLTSAIGPIFGGLIVDHLGYTPLFSLSMAFLMAGLGILLTLVEEPRNRRKATV